MKYCPECETEYLDRAERCADCGCPLVSEEEHEASRAAPGGGAPLAMLCAVGDQLEADRLSELLEREGVSTYLHRYEESVYIGHSDLHQGFGELWVPAPLRQRALALIEEL